MVVIEAMERMRDWLESVPEDLCEKESIPVIKEITHPVLWTPLFLEGNIGNSPLKKGELKGGCNSDNYSNSLGFYEETQGWLDFSRSCKYISEETHKRLDGSYDEVSAMLFTLMKNRQNFSEGWFLTTVF